mgnify:CR=1 FL=1
MRVEMTWSAPSAAAIGSTTSAPDAETMTTSRSTMMSVACLMCEHCSLRDTRVEMRVNEAIAKQKAGEAK